MSGLYLLTKKPKDSSLVLLVLPVLVLLVVVIAVKLGFLSTAAYCMPAILTILLIFHDGFGGGELLDCGSAL